MMDLLLVVGLGIGLFVGLWCVPIWIVAIVFRLCCGYWPGSDDFL